MCKYKFIELIKTVDSVHTCKPSWSGNLLRKSGFACRIYLCGSLKAQAKLLSKCNGIAFFGTKLQVMLLRFWFSKTLSNKISFALILKRKSCICCRKHCRSLFPQAHGMCGLKEIFEGAGNFFKKVPANPTLTFG